MNRMVYCTDAFGIVQGHGPAVNWSRFHVTPAEGAAVRTGDEGRPERYRAAVARFERLCRDAELSAKADRAVELMSRIVAARSRPIPDAENAGPSAAELASLDLYHPSAGEMDARRKAAEDEVQRCREAEAAYAARNPHKKQENLDLAGWPANPAERVEGHRGGRV